MAERFGRDNRIALVRGDCPEYLLVLPADMRELDGADRQAELVAERTHAPFTLVELGIADWNAELSPWEAPPVFGRQGFGSGAAQTLSYISDQLVPGIVDRCDLASDIPVILGGYSLAGLFALWSAFRTDRFAAIVAASPSVWFPGWIELAATHEPLAQCIYLSLGDREEKAKNPVMARVGECIRRQHRLLEDQGVDTVLEWNPGNHFKDPDVRLAKGFAWCMG